MARRTLDPRGLVWLGAVIVGLGFAAAVFEVSKTAYGAAASALRNDTDTRLADVATQADAQVDRWLVDHAAAVEASAERASATAIAPAAIARSVAVANRRYADGGSTSVVDAHGRLLAAVDADGRVRVPPPDGMPSVPLAPERLRAALSSTQVRQIDAEDDVARLLPPAARTRTNVVFSAPIRTTDARPVGVWLHVVPSTAIDHVVASTLTAAQAFDLHLYVLDRKRRVIGSDLVRTAHAAALDPSPALMRIVSGERTVESIPADLFNPGASGTDLVAAAQRSQQSRVTRMMWSVVATEYRREALAPARRLDRGAQLVALLTTLAVLAAAAIVALTLRRAARQRAQVEETLQRSQRLEALGRLAGGIAHDFTNALTVIGGNAQLALAHAPPDDVGTNLREILYSSERASDLVRRLLAFSRPDPDTVTAVDLNDAVEDLVRILPRLIEANVEIATDLAPEPVPVLADPSQLEQVLVNLAVNARDAMPGGGTLTFRTGADDATVRLEVADTGAGMDAATRERLFEPFFTTKASGEGTGLGLATVYAVVTQTGGSIAVDSAPGEGTTFTIELPRAPAAPESPAGSGADEVAPGRGERLLVVEDDERVGVVAVGMLTRAGYEVEAVADGRSALELLERGARFDLLVCDIMLPRMTGLQLADELGRRGYDVPIVFTSGYSAVETVAPDPDARPTIVTKPFREDELTHAVRRNLA